LDSTSGALPDAAAVPRIPTTPATPELEAGKPPSIEVLGTPEAMEFQLFMSD
jgi:hypothetical protein